MLYFILGMLCYAIVIPIIEMIIGLLETLVEWPKGVIALKIAKCNTQIQEMSDALTPTSTQAIGFITDSNEYYEDEDDDE